MRILHIGKYYTPYRGGIETVTESLAEGLQKKGHEVTVLCSSTEPRRSVENIRGVKVVRLPTFGKFASQPLTPSFFAEIGRYAEQSDIVHVHSPNPLVEAICTRLPEGTPLVCTYHCEVVRQKFLKKFYRPIQIDFLKKCAQIVVSSPQNAENSEVLPQFKKRVEVVPFGIHDLQFSVDDEVKSLAADHRNEYGSYHLFVGRLVSYKGLDVLLRAIKDTNEKVIIIGVGPEKENLKSLAAELGVGERAVFKGAVESDTEFLSLFIAATSFVLPSNTEAEAFGMVLIEAMSLGLPVVSTRLKSGVSFVNQDRVSGLQVEPNDPAGLSSALQEISSNEVLNKELSVGARNRYEKLFSQHAMTESYVGIYNSMFGFQN